MRRRISIIMSFIFLVYLCGIVSVQASTSHTPVAAWTFDETEGSKAFDSSGGGSTGALSGSPTWVDGKINGGLHFNNKTRDFVNAGTSNFSLANEMTISMWFKCDGYTGGNQTLIQRGKYVYPFKIGLGYTKAANKGLINTIVRTTKTNYLSAEEAINFGEWYHLALCYKSGETVIYINGEKVKSSSTAKGALYTKDTKETTFIGGTDAGDYFNGTIDNVLIYDKTLTMEEIQEIYKSNEAPGEGPDGTKDGTPGGNQPGTPGGDSSGTPNGNPADTPNGNPNGTPDQIQKATYYIDYENGNDNNSGTSENAAWKHAPGDPAAAGKAALAVPAAGETVLFRAGVVYRGNIVMKSGGEQNKPVIYKGEGWGSGKAIIDGSEIITGTWRKCSSSKVCAGNPRWQDIYYIDIPGQMNTFSTVYENNKLLWFGQDPNQPDPFWYNTIKNYRTVPLNDPNIVLTRTTLKDKSYFTQDSPDFWDGAYIAGWVKANRVHISKITGYDPSAQRITFDDLGGDVYTDRASYYSIINHVSLLDMPGEYAFDESTGRLFLLPDNSSAAPSNISVGRRTRAIDLNRHSNITIEGFKIQNFSGGPKGYYQGVAIYNTAGSPVSNIVIHGNEITNCRSMEGSGVICALNLNNSLVENNNIHENQLCSAMNCVGSNITIKSNTISKMGRDAFAVMNAHKVAILNNTIHGILDVHANAISVYLNNSDILVAGNSIYEANRPLTFHGDGNNSTYNNLVVYNNIFVSQSENATVNSWGNGMDEVILLNNIMINKTGNVGLNLHRTDKKVIVKNNIMDGFTGASSWWKPGVGWDLSNNIYTELSWMQNARYGWSLGTGEILEKDLGKLFENCDAYDLHPAQSSPSIDTGVNIGSYLPARLFPGFDFGRDADGETRADGGKWDIGCYEN